MAILYDIDTQNAIMQQEDLKKTFTGENPNISQSKNTTRS
jgi:hypothetical protein